MRRTEDEASAHIASVLVVVVVESAGLLFRAHSLQCPVRFFISQALRESRNNAAKGGRRAGDALEPTTSEASAKGTKARPG